MIAILRAESPLPISTVALADRLGLSPFERQARLYPILDRLATRGQVERLSFEGYRCRFWRLTSGEAPADADE